jgi:hypothetical protein
VKTEEVEIALYLRVYPTPTIGPQLGGAVVLNVIFGDGVSAIVHYEIFGDGVSAVVQNEILDDGVSAVVQNEILWCRTIAARPYRTDLVAYGCLPCLPESARTPSHS